MSTQKGGYIKRTDPEEFRTQKRGGVGVVDLDTKRKTLYISLTASTHADMLFFTDKGKAYQIKMYELPEGRKTRNKRQEHYEFPPTNRRREGDKHSRG